MAEFIAKFNSVDKTFTFTEDGKEVPNVVYVSFGPSYSYDSEPGTMAMNVSMREEEDDQGVCRTHSLSASKCREDNYRDANVSEILKRVCK